MNTRNIDRVHVAGTILLTTGCLYGLARLTYDIGTRFVTWPINREPMWVKEHEGVIELTAGEE